MKKIMLVISMFASSIAFSQSAVENIIVVTTDGFRWQEVFGGMDSAIASNPSFNQKDSIGIFNRYWASSTDERRKKLMPFLWNVLSSQGQIYGNRNYGNNVDNKNPYWFSYPGYSEIFCGYVDTAVNSNAYPPNPNTNVLEFIYKQPAFHGSVAAFGAWDAFDRIFNEDRSGFPVTSGKELCGGKGPNAIQQLMNKMKTDSYLPFGEEEYLDLFTHYMAMNYLQKSKPRVLYIGYGETDEWAHAGHYKDYLNSAHQVDKWLSDIWTYVQNDPQYKNKTALLVTVDHGRGDIIKTQWTSHNNKIQDSHQIWFALIGPGIPAKGEVKQKEQLYQQQFAETIAELLGLHFTCEHPVAESIPYKN